jgi:hypothetical protein
VIIKQKNMTVISSKEFATNQKKYYDLAIRESVLVKRGKNKFLVSNANNEYDEVLAPDDDFRRAITADELLKRIYEDIDKKFANRL